MDADPSDHFTTIPHDPLLMRVTRRFADGTVPSVLEQWLTTSAFERAVEDETFDAIGIA